MTSTEVKLCAAITTQSRQSLLAATPLTAISVWFTDNNTLMLKGVEQLVCRAEAHVLRVVYEALHQVSAANSLASQYPDTWLPQSTANTELFEVKCKQSGGQTPGSGCPSSRRNCGQGAPHSKQEAVECICAQSGMHE